MAKGPTDESSGQSRPDSFADALAAAISRLRIRQEGETQSASSSAAQERPTTGATFSPEYYDYRPQVIGMDMNYLQDFDTSTRDEFLQFSFGGFLLSGGIWLGLERIFTVENPGEDPLTWICALASLAGSIIAIFGYRQLRRRQSYVGRIIANAVKRPSGTLST